MFNWRNWLGIGVVLSACFPENGSAGVRVGNGGHYLVCNSGTTETVEVLDHFEAVHRYRLVLDTGDSKKPYTEQLEFILKRISEISPWHSEWIRNAVEHVKANMTFISDLGQGETPDIGNFFIPSNCRIAQGVVRIKPELPSETEYYFNEKLWNKLDERNKAMIFVHEAIYKDRVDYGKKSSLLSRLFTGYLASTKMNNVSAKEWLWIGNYCEADLPLRMRFRTQFMPDGMECNEIEIHNPSPLPVYEEHYRDCYGKYSFDLGSKGNAPFTITSDNKYVPIGNLSYTSSGGTTLFWARHIYGSGKSDLEFEVGSTKEKVGIFIGNESGQNGGHTQMFYFYPHSNKVRDIHIENHELRVSLFGAPFDFENPLQHARQRGSEPGMGVLSFFPDGRLKSLVKMIGPWNSRIPQTLRGTLMLNGFRVGLDGISQCGPDEAKNKDAYLCATVWGAPSQFRRADQPDKWITLKPGQLVELNEKGERLPV